MKHSSERVEGLGRVGNYLMSSCMLGVSIVAYLADCYFLEAPKFLVKVFLSSCVVQNFGWIAKII